MTEEPKAEPALAIRFRSTSGLIRRVGGSILWPMLRGLRALAVIIVITLGLIAQGVGMPAMAASGPGTARSECQSVSGVCPGSGMTHHLHVQRCSVPCFTVPALPGPSLAVLSLTWPGQVYAAKTDGLPPGLSLAPDPFPPKSRALA